MMQVSLWTLGPRLVSVICCRACGLLVVDVSNLAGSDLSPGKPVCQRHKTLQSLMLSFDALLITQDPCTLVIARIFSTEDENFRRL